MEAKFYVSMWENIYDKILKIYDYFKNININIMFLLYTSEKIMNGNKPNNL